ncbi:MAG: bifunctional glutamate N-acetyltransferase/amino-acid acetyltransferase ArgJ [Pseudomonadales bacterium]
MAIDVLAAGKPVPGIRLAAAAVGIKKNAGLDLVVIEASAGSTVAAVFTQNKFCAAPVLLARQHLTAADNANAVYCLINSGNANAGTGREGLHNASLSCAALAKLASVNEANVLPFSTGVIGEQLAVEKIQRIVPDMFAELKENAWEAAAQAVMTTDTRAKIASRQFTIASNTFVVTGIAKGAGMIRPNMATMLSFIATDLAVEQSVLQSVLAGATKRTFNRITVDGDTSTNDACVLFATGANVSQQLQKSDTQLEIFSGAVEQVCLDLAQQIVRDAEGATKFVTVQVLGGNSESDCEAIAYTVAESPLVKTALYASDPNWGRILAAIGRAPVTKLDVDKVRLSIDDVLIAEQGAVAKSYDEALASEVMRQTEFTVRIELGAGEASFALWTSDLSHDYVTINADYRT